jgi:hypothetical protein
VTNDLARAVTQAAADADQLRVHQFSSGITSWAVAHLDIQANGRDNVVLLFADTLAEDDDNYRFLRDAAEQLGVPVTRVCDGRTPEQVDIDARWLSNSRLAKCSHELKQIPCRQWMTENTTPDAAVVYVGLTWDEAHRADAIRRWWQPWRVELPLMRPPYRDKDHWLREARRLGLEPPRMYAMGFPHANCGGTCPRGGQAQHALLLRTFPDRFARREDHERRMQALLDADHTILRDRTDGVTKQLPLAVLRRRIEAKDEGMLAFDELDWGGCGCFTDTAEKALDGNHG